MAKLGICVDNLFAVRRRLDTLSSNLMCLQKSLGIFDRVLDTPSRHNQADACFCARLFVSLASPWILPLGNVQINSTLPSLIRTLASPKILPLGKMQTSLLLPSLIRIFDFVEDTLVRQCSNKFDIALTYSYLCLRINS